MLRILFFLLVFTTTIFAQQKPELVVQLGHSSTIRQIDISRDGKYMVSTGADQAVKIWENKTGKLLKTMFLEREAYTILFDSNNLVWVGMEKKMLIYNLKGELIHSLPSHKDAPNAMDLSPDGKIIASGGWDKKIILWDTDKKSQIATLEGHNSEVKSLFFNKDGSQILSCESYGKKEEGIIKNIFLWDIKTQKAKKIRGGETLPTWATFSADNTKILYIGGNVWQAGIYGCIDIATEKTLYEKNTPEGLHWISPTKNQSEFLVGGASFANIAGRDRVQATLYQVKLDDGKVINGDNTFTDGIIWCVRYSSVLNTIAYTVGHQIKMADAGSLKIFKELKTLGEPYWNISRSKNDKIVSSSAVYWDRYRNATRIWDFSKGKIDKIIEKYEDEINNSVVDVKGRFVASATRGGMMRVIGIDEDMDASLRLKNNDNLKDVAIHPNGTFVMGVSKNGGLLALSLKDGNYKLKGVEKASYTAIDFDKDGKFFIAGLGNGKTEIWEVNPKDLLNMDSYKVIYTIDAITEKAGSISMTGSVSDVKISPDGNIVAIGSSTNIKIVDLITMQTKMTLKAESGVTGLAFSDDGKYLACGARYKINVFDLTTQKIVASLSGHQNDVMAVCFSKSGKYLYSGSLDTQIKIWDWKEKKELLSATSIAGTQDYIFYTPDGYYLASKGGTKALIFKIDNKNYPFEQFDLKYNRPDKVLKVLTEIEYGKMQGSPNELLIEAYTKAYQKRIKKMNFSEENLITEFHLPEVQITTNNISKYTKKSEISIEIKATDSKYNLNRLYVSVNGVLLEGIKGRTLYNKSKSVSEKIYIPLSQGKNLIEISVLNEKGVESLKEQFEVNYDTPLGMRKSTIHLVTVGVSEYQNAQMNLRYAAKDGKDLASLFQKSPMLQSSPQNVEPKIVHHALFDKEATKENVLKLKKELEKTRVDDMVIIFVSGHGLLDKNLDYFIATHNVDFGKPSEKGLSYEDLENLLDGIPARQKVLLMDACHSGEIDKEEVQMVASNNTIKKEGLKFKNFGEQTVQNKNVGLQNSFELSKQLFTDLRRGSGTTVLSAASGVQLAQESTEWQNGAFTYCLLNGLQNMKADLNSDGKVMLSELQKYLFEEVPRLTGGVQQPTSRIENLTHDFRVW